MSKTATIKALAKASKGLLFVSETEAGFEPFEWSGGETIVAPGKILEHSGYEYDANVEEVTLPQFFRAVPREDRESFEALAAFLNELLSDVRVFKVGEVRREVFIVGRTAAGTLAGLKTEVVET